MSNSKNSADVSAVGGHGAPAGAMTLATIVATIGPASESPEMVRRLILAGVNVFRFNFSHGSEADHARRLAVVREAGAAIGRATAILGDLPGPKIRVTKTPDAGIELEAGQDVVIDPNATMADPARAGGARGGAALLGCTIRGIGETVSPGQRVLINDGAIRLLSVDKAAGDPAGAIRCRVMVGGLVTTGKGINFPASPIKVEAMTERDWAWAAWAVANDLDYLALSFVRTADEIIELKRVLSEKAGALGRLDSAGTPVGIPVVAKMEKPQAVTNMESIVQAADAIMVARGDLGVETDVAQVPVIQKRLIACAESWGKPCIVATQMLETMITSSTPTRAEASDVANAIFDGADAVMLSGETAVGKHPVLVVETMKRIIGVAEERIREKSTAPTPPLHELEQRRRTAALAHAAWHAARDYGAKLVVVWSQEGGAARYLSQTGFQIPIVAYSSSERATRRMQLLRGVTSVRLDPCPERLSAWNLAVDEYLMKEGLAVEGDAIVLIAGLPLGERGSPNALAMHRVGERSGFHAHR